METQQNKKLLIHNVPEDYSAIGEYILYAKHFQVNLGSKSASFRKNINSLKLPNLTAIPYTKNQEISSMVDYKSSYDKVLVYSAYDRDLLIKLNPSKYSNTVIQLKTNSKTRINLYTTLYDSLKGTKYEKTTKILVPDIKDIVKAKCVVTNEVEELDNTYFLTVRDTMYTISKRLVPDNIKFNYVSLTPNQLKYHINKGSIPRNGTVLQQYIKGVKKYYVNCIVSNGKVHYFAVEPYNNAYGQFKCSRLKCIKEFCENLKDIFPGNNFFSFTYVVGKGDHGIYAFKLGLDHHIELSLKTRFSIPHILLNDFLDVPIELPKYSGKLISPGYFNMVFLK